MYSAVTHDIRVTVMPRFLPERSSPGQYVWSYTIEVANLGARTVRLVSRHWRICDARGHVQEVHGEGVVGEQPWLAPGERFQYTSGAPLTTPSGMMSGSYGMVADDGTAFEVEIPAFSLDSPDERRVVN
jgi:ApaG protein